MTCEDHSNHDVSNEPMNPFSEYFFDSFDVL